MAEAGDILDRILARKRQEVDRRLKRRHIWRSDPPKDAAARVFDATARLRRRAALNVIAEIKFRSPSAGQIRPFVPGSAAQIAMRYVEGGACALSVLADGPGFGGSPLTVRRVAALGCAPVLFKEFVLHEVQLDIAQKMGASYVLLIVRALSAPRLERLITASVQRGLAPIVEAADHDEVRAAVASSARIIGVNARNLRTFKVDPAAAEEQLAQIPGDRIAAYLSGVRSKQDFKRVAAGRADAVLIGEGLMREGDPTTTLREWREE